MNNLFRHVIESLLPWYDAARERRRDDHTEHVVRRSEVAQERASRAIADYRRADDVARKAGERVIDEVRR